MPTLTLGLNIELKEEVTDEELSTLTAALLEKLEKATIETIGDVFNETRPTLAGSIEIGRFEPVEEVEPQAP